MVFHTRVRLNCCVVQTSGTMRKTAFTYTHNNGVLVLEFCNQQLMSECLEDVSTFFEGKTTIMRIGHNFPVSKLKEFVRHCSKTRTVKPPFVEVLDNLASACACVYVVAHVRGDIHTKRHELQHAKYHINLEYKASVDRFWNSLDTHARDKITHFLCKLGYPQHVIIDEFQAYYFTEKPNFFGITLENRFTDG